MMRIRLATPDDGAALSDIYRPAVAYRATSFEVDPPDAAEMARRVAATLEHYPWLVCEDAGAVIGYAYASRHRERAAYQWAVEVSAYVRDGVHRKGVGRRLYESLFRVLALQGYQRAFAGITPAERCERGISCGAWLHARWRLPPDRMEARQRGTTSCGSNARCRKISRLPIRRRRR